MTLKEKLRAAASADPNLSGLLGSAPFRWYDIQLSQGSAFPAVVVQIIATVPLYGFTMRAQRPVQSRVQFTIWGGQNDVGRETAIAVDTALKEFLDGFDAIGIPGLARYPNYVRLERDGFFYQADTGIFQRLIDVAIWNDETSQAGLAHKWKTLDRSF